MKKKTILVILVITIIISATNVCAMGDVGTASTKAAPQYPLISFSLDQKHYPSGSTIQLVLNKYPSNSSNASNSDFTWSVSNSSYSISSTGVLTTPTFPSKTQITITHNPTNVWYTCTIQSGPIENGFYRIKNAKTGDYLTSTFFDLNNRTKCLSIDGSILQIWNIVVEQNSDTFYSIKSILNQSYLTIESISGTDYISTTLTRSDINTRWNFIEREMGYSIQTGNNSTDVVDIPQDTHGYLQHLPYTNDSDYGDEWILESVNMNAYFVGLIDDTGGHDHVSFITDCKENMEYIGAAVDSSTATSFAKSSILSSLQTHGFFAYRGHGSIYNGNIESCIDIGNNNVISSYDITTSAMDLSDCIFAFFMACETGAGAFSLPEAAVSAGAEFAIGCKYDILCNEANTLTVLFVSNYSGGYSIETSFDNALTTAYGGLLNKSKFSLSNNYD